MGSEFFELDNDGEVARMEITETGEIFFHDFDPEAEEAAEELGFEPGVAYRVWKALNAFMLDEDTDLLDDCLVWCCETGEFEAVRALITVGADPHGRGNAPIQRAALEGHADVVELLLEHGVSALLGRHVARNIIRNGHLDVVKVLLPAGTFEGLYSMSLTYAHEFDQEEILELLREHVSVLAGESADAE